MDFTMLPPEVNSGRMYAGPGSGPMLAAASAWDGLAAELQSTANSYESAISELTGGPWLGPSSASMAAAAAPYMEWMTTTAAQAEQTATQAKAAAAAYEAAFAMTVPPPLIAANRSLLMTLIATNIFGQNTMAIAATETDYAEMWAQDAAAMYGYAGSSATASTLTSFTSPPPTTNPAGAGSQGAAVTQSSTSGGSQLMSAVPQALQGLASSAAADPLSASALSDLLSLLTVPLTLLAIPISTTSVGTSATSISATLTGVGMNLRGFEINADRDFAKHQGPYTGYGPGAADLPNWFFNGQGYVGAPSNAVESSVSAGLGQANTVGRLSVPSAWTVAAPEIRPVAYTLPITGAQAAPEMGAGSSGNLFSNMGLAGAAGGAVGSSASLGRGDQRTRTTNRGNPKPPQRPPGEPVAEIAAELREIAARAQSLLAKLADSGLMTAEEVTEQKRQFAWPVG
ncbi:MAG: PPE family protein [Mycobacterium sp.]|uniref:PPE family protein n=1 Tax=Mycobacterium sp. TaxID=1785 RepID=UPI003C7201D7